MFALCTVQNSILHVQTQATLWFVGHCKWVTLAFVSLNLGALPALDSVRPKPRDCALRAGHSTNVNSFNFGLHALILCRLGEMTTVSMKNLCKF